MQQSPKGPVSLPSFGFQREDPPARGAAAPRGHGRVNAVEHRERSKAARHEAAHVAAAWLLGETLDDVEIVPAPRGGGYLTGSCAAARGRKIGAVVLAVGVRDAHGAWADEFELEQMVPDPDQRAEVLDVARQVMDHPEFVRVRNALWRRLTFADRMQRRDLQDRDRRGRSAGEHMIPDLELSHGVGHLEVCNGVADLDLEVSTAVDTWEVLTAVKTWGSRRG